METITENRQETGAEDLPGDALEQLEQTTTHIEHKPLTRVEGRFRMTNALFFRLVGETSEALCRQDS